MDEIKLRHEYKHAITYSDYLAIRNRLKVVAKPDVNVLSDGHYAVRSLYFDNLNDKALRQKIDGVNFREKFRIRFYGENLNCIRLEKKMKINGLCAKLSSAVSREECRQLLDGDCRWMSSSQQPLILEFYTKLKTELLKPRTIVDYIREPYVYNPGNVRITIDFDIRTGLYHNDFLDLGVPMISTNSPMILEVKYDQFLPEVIQSAVQVSDTRTEAFSKYACCRMYG